MSASWDSQDCGQLIVSISQTSNIYGKFKTISFKPFPLIRIRAVKLSGNTVKFTDPSINVDISPSYAATNSSKIDSRLDFTSSHLIYASRYLVFHLASL